MEAPLCAVTTMVMVRLPADMKIGGLTVPELTGIPLTVMEAPLSNTAGVTLTAVAEFRTLAS
jgi:hypothetical protein